MKTPYPYQQTAIEVIERKNLLLNDDCGLGKTIVAIETAKLIQSRINRPVLVVVPKTLIDQWATECINQGISRNLITGSLSCGQFENGAWIITNYEQVTKYIVALSKQYFSCVIVDEAHRIKNRKAKRTIAIKQLSAFRKLAMTGTAYDRNPADIWSIFNWLEPQFFSSYWSFFDAHVNYREEIFYGKTVKTIAPNQPKNTENFARLLRQFSLKRTKADVKPDLPERIDQYIDLMMNSDQAKYYRSIANAEDMIVKLDELTEHLITIQLTRILRLIQATTDPTLLGVRSSSVKLEWVQEWLEDNPDESVIICTRFRDTAISLAKQLGNSFKLIIGGNRQPISKNDTKIVGTIAAMGEGLDLPHIDHTICIDTEWSSILMQQLIDRTHRINIDNVKHIYYLRCKDTVDELVHTAIRNKWSTKELVDSFLRYGSVKP